MTKETIVSEIAIALILFGVLFYFFSKLVKSISKNIPQIVFFVTIFIAGLMLNWLAINYFYGKDENPVNIFKLGAIFSITLKMFAGFNWDVSIWSPLAKQNILYSIAITLCFVSAVLYTASLVVHLFFKNLWNSISIFFLTNFSKRTWIIAGMGVYQGTLLKGLTPEQKKSTIIIPNKINDEVQKEYLAQGFLIINAKLSVDILKKAGFFDKKETALIAISDNDVENLDIARTITSYLKTRSDKDREKLNFSVHIMYTNIERVEHFKFSESAGGKIQFFNPYEITARSFLFENPITKFIPLSNIDTETAHIKTGFDFLHVFIGFGKTNSELLKQSIAANQILGVDYRALVIDTDIKDKKSIFINQCHGIFINREEWDDKKYFPAPHEKYHIDFIECNVLSKEMYGTVINCVKKVDASAVIVSLENDQSSAETAMEFRQQCYEESIKNVNIFIRAKEDSSIIAEDVLNDNTEIKIKLFGFEDEIISLEHIINRDMDILAKHIAENYSGDTSIEYPSKWDELSNHERESNLYAALSIRIKLNLMGFDLIYDKTENSIQDKNILTEFAHIYELEPSQKLRNEKKYLSYIKRNPDGSIANTARNNLARLEHQRWNSYYLVKGWTPLPKDKVSAASRKNPQTKKHACITTFEGLDKLTQLQANKKREDDPALDYQAALEKYDTMHLDCDQIDCLIGNIANTKYRIVKLG
ncbi:hypothetical protein FACS1894172_08230 [Spirochaetia bacterium]|nr:hypothetical protein FACS1894164_07830 [Spirochaetia bacterium]GHU32136.1 hypothetical protein FACS1894172_08230 [Spirochaetia bacterium]